MDGKLDELTAVQRVALLGLRLRALDACSDSPILGDDVSVQVAEALGLDVRSPRIPRSVVLVHAVRARMLDRLVGRFVGEHPTAVVLDVGCGLDSRRQRCAPPPGVDWYDVDLPAITALREWLLPDGGHVVAADITTAGWLDAAVPRDRPAMVVTDGLMALLSAAAFIGMTRAVTTHFAHGELAFNAYSRLALRNGHRMRGGPLSMPVAGDGIDDPREPEAWGAGLSLIDEHRMARAPEVDRFPPVLRAFTRLSARSTRLARAADRVVHYGFRLR